MAELLSSLDVVNQAFKKTLRGYDPAEVDEFLDRVAESIQFYVQKNKDFERSVEELSEKLNDYENIKNSLHETLLMAQRTAEEKVNNAAAVSEEKIIQARKNAEDIVSDARTRAERIIKDAEDSVIELGNELKKLDEMRASGFSVIRTMTHNINSAIDSAESTGNLQLPSLADELIKRKPVPHSRQEAEISRIMEVEDEKPADEAVKMQEISEALNILGIDPDLMSVQTDDR